MAFQNTDRSSLSETKETRLSIRVKNETQIAPVVGVRRAIHQLQDAAQVPQLGDRRARSAALQGTPGDATAEIGRKGGSRTLEQKRSHTHPGTKSSAGTKIAKTNPPNDRNIRRARRLVVYDLTNLESFANLDDWLACVQRVFTDKYTGEKLKMPQTYIVGNKADLLRHRQVVDSDHAGFWRSRGLAGGFLTSASSGDNVARTVYQTAAHAVGIDLTSDELAFHDRAIRLNAAALAEPDDGGGRTYDADRIEAEDRAAELRKHKSCGCTLS